VGHSLSLRDGRHPFWIDMRQHHVAEHRIYQQLLQYGVLID
jgi:hypothetical protein